MKKHLLALLLLAPGLAAAQTTYPFLVKGKIGQLSAPAKIYLVYGPQVLDSATLENGAFEMKGATDWPHSAALVLARQGKLGDNANGQAYFQAPDRQFIFLSPEPVTVTSADSLPKARVVGGPQLAAYQRLNATLKPFAARFKAARAQGESAALAKEYAQTVRAFIKANPNAWASLEQLQQLQMEGPPPYAEVAPLYEAFSPELKNSGPGRFYGEMLQGLKATAIGAEAPNFTQATPDGKQVSLADYRGKYVLVDFWASWCGPCRQENPAVIKAYNAYKGRNFDILGVSLDKEGEQAKWLKAIQDDHLAWTQVSDLQGWQNAAAQRYGVRSIPQNFLIDPAGKIVAANLRGDELQAKLAQLIK
ncbi:MAG: AhpC/TSA family protein [Hymenobacter sp.]|nr:MAG: AhpC/TSA family protein [Hymenobacter sp.]